MNELVIDMLEGFTRKGPLANPRIARLLPKQAEFLKAIPPSYGLFACDMHDPSDPEFARFPVNCLKGTEEANICPELIEACNERDHVFTVVHKHTPSAFFKTLVEPKIPAEPKFPFPPKLGEKAVILLIDKLGVLIVSRHWQITDFGDEGSDW